MNYGMNIKRLLASMDEKELAIVKRVNEEMLRAKSVTPGTLHNNATLSNLSVQYKNAEYIGEKLMPVVAVAHKSDDYWLYDKRDRLRAPDDKIGARGRANELSENRSTATYSCRGCRDYALKNFVDNDLLRDQDAPLDEMVDLTEALNDAMALKREQRIASVLTTAGNYSGNTEALAGADQFDNASNTSIIAKMQNAVASLWTGPGPGKLVGFCSLEVWNAIARNEKIRGLFSANQEGLASTKQVASYFGLDEILVSAARQDTSNEGASASYSRIFGKVFGIVRVAQSPSIRNASFGYTFRLKGDPKTDFWYDPAVGKSGGWYARVGISEDHKVVAGDTGFLFTAAIA
jgi:hypothetical protein